MRSALCAAACLFPFLSACPDDAEWDGPEAFSDDPGRHITSSQTLRVTRKAGAAAPRVLASVELSAGAVELFESLEASVDVFSAESLESASLRAQWLGAPAEPVRARFEGEWSTVWSAQLPVSSSPCDATPCLLSLELVPEGDWKDALSFPIEYVLVSRLVLRASDPDKVGYGLRLELEEAP